MLRFWLLGAWPVAAFSAVEIGIAIFLLRLNARRARASELVLLSEDVLRVVRTDRTGRRQERVLPAAWLNAVLEEPPGRVPTLVLVTRGVREEIPGDWKVQEFQQQLGTPRAENRRQSKSFPASGNSYPSGNQSRLVFSES